MESTLHKLGDLLVQAIPTILFFLFLTYYLKQVFFKPVAHILEERRKATEGVRELAERAAAAADAKSSEFERALQIARGDIAKEHEAQRQIWLQEQADAVAKARADAEAQLEN